LLVEGVPLQCWDCCLSRSRLLLFVSDVVSMDACGDKLGLGECILKSLVKDDIEGFRRARLGGGHPSTSSFEFGEASIVWRSTKNDS